MERSEIKEIVRKSEMFSTLDDDELDLLLYYGDEKRFPSGRPSTGPERRRRGHSASFSGEPSRLSRKPID
jgi:hypothetical protein